MRKYLLAVIFLTTTKVNANCELIKAHYKKICERKECSLNSSEEIDATLDVLRKLFHLQAKEKLSYKTLYSLPFTMENLDLLLRPIELCEINPSRLWQSTFSFAESKKKAKEISLAVDQMLLSVENQNMMELMLQMINLKGALRGSYLQSSSADKAIEKLDSLLMKIRKNEEKNWELFDQAIRNKSWWQRIKITFYQLYNNYWAKERSEEFPLGFEEDYFSHLQNSLRYVETIQGELEAWKKEFSVNPRR